MMPTAHEIAIAIVAAAREMRCNPIDVVTDRRRETFPEPEDYFRVSRARCYAAAAVDRVFNRPEVCVSRPSIARMVGVSHVPSQSSYFAFLTRTNKWWDEAILRRVVDQVMDAEPPGEQIAPEQNSVNQIPEKPVSEPPPYKDSPPPPKPKEPVQPARLERGGFRPASDTYARTIAEDRREERQERPVKKKTTLDKYVDRQMPREGYAGSADQLARRAAERRQCGDLLAEAAANTRKLQDAMPPEPGENRESDEERQEGVD